MQLSMSKLIFPAIRKNFFVMPFQCGCFAKIVVMKRLFVCIIFMLSISSVRAQTDQVLLQRLSAVLIATQQSDFTTILNYTYPKLYTIVPKDKLLEVLKEALETEDFSTTLDSVLLVKVHTVFTIGTASYAKIEHTMIMRMKFKEPIDTVDEEGNNLVLQLMQSGFGKENVRIDIKNNTINVFSAGILVAIKDEFATNWCFVNFDGNESSPIMPLLFSEEVLAKLKTFN